MPDPLRPLRLNALELLRERGTTRGIDVELDPAVLDAVDPRLDGDVGIRLTCESLDEGIVVTGTVSLQWRSVCRRCVRPLAETAVVEVDESYRAAPADEDFFPIENNQLDLVPLAREAVLLEVAEERLCRVECAGLCPVCGADRNLDPCRCDTSVRDERWAALDELRLDG